MARTDTEILVGRSAYLPEPTPRSRCDFHVHGTRARMARSVSSPRA
jgi:hypothetical protein